jgi:hypothetical protein
VGAAVEEEGVGLQSRAQPAKLGVAAEAGAVEEEEELQTLALPERRGEAAEVGVGVEEAKPVRE